MKRISNAVLELLYSGFSIIRNSSNKRRIRTAALIRGRRLGTGHKVQRRWAMKNWGWVTIFQHVKRGGSGKIMHCIRGGSS